MGAKDVDSAMGEVPPVTLTLASRCLPFTPHRACAREVSRQEAHSEDRDRTTPERLLSLLGGWGWQQEGAAKADGGHRCRDGGASCSTKGGMHPSECNMSYFLNLLDRDHNNLCWWSPFIICACKMAKKGSGDKYSGKWLHLHRTLPGDGH